MSGPYQGASGNPFQAFWPLQDLGDCNIQWLPTTAARDTSNSRSQSLSHGSLASSNFSVGSFFDGNGRSQPAVDYSQSYAAQNDPLYEYESDRQSQAFDVSNQDPTVNSGIPWLNSPNQHFLVPDSQQIVQVPNMKIARTVPPVGRTLAPAARHFCDAVGCQQTFARKTDIPRHKQSVHGDGVLLYTCTAVSCKYETRRKDKMQEHCRRHGQPRRGEQFEVVLCSKDAGAARSFSS